MSDQKKNLNSAELASANGGASLASTVKGYYPQCPRCYGTTYPLHLGFEVIRPGQTVAEQVLFQQAICESCLQPELAPYYRDGYRFVRWIDNLYG